MRSVGLKVLKNKLSEYVRLAAGGETVLVTDRDRVVPRSCRRAADAARSSPTRCWPRRCAKGWITPPTLVGEGPPPRKPVMTMRELMEALRADREDR